MRVSKGLIGKKEAINMAPEDNWLSFSLSPMAMFSSSTSQPQMLQSTMKFDGSSSADSQQYYFFDNFYANGR